MVVSLCVSATNTYVRIKDTFCLHHFAKCATMLARFSSIHTITKQERNQIPWNYPIKVPGAAKLE